MKPSLQFRLSQHLTLTPQLQQSIRLLQLSTVELNQEIDRLLMDNPALEREDSMDDAGHGDAPAAPVARGPAETSAEAPPPSETEWPVDAANWRGAEGDEENDKNFTAPDTPTLRDHLHTQLSLTKLNPRDRVFVGLLIDALDEDGYLTQPLEEIAALLPVEAEADPESFDAQSFEPESIDPESFLRELSIALQHLQHFEPPGVGARSPSE